jgi:hypothetical protein
MGNIRRGAVCVTHIKLIFFAIDVHFHPAFHKVAYLLMRMGMQRDLDMGIKGELTDHDGFTGC